MMQTKSSCCVLPITCECGLRLKTGVQSLVFSRNLLGLQILPFALPELATAGAIALRITMRYDYNNTFCDFVTNLNSNNMYHSAMNTLVRVLFALKYTRTG